MCIYCRVWSWCYYPATSRYSPTIFLVSLCAWRTFGLTQGECTCLCNVGVWWLTGWFWYRWQWRIITLYYTGTGYAYDTSEKRWDGQTDRRLYRHQTVALCTLLRTRPVYQLVVNCAAIRWRRWITSTSAHTSRTAWVSVDLCWSRTSKKNWILALTTSCRRTLSSPAQC